MPRTGAAAHPAAHDSTPLVARVFAALCDGRFHSGEQLARALGVSRSAIWKATGALRELGVVGAGLKWPNDLLLGERKLGGVLIELRAESAGPACVVIGIGLNVALGAALLQRISESGMVATDLRSAGLAQASRNSVAAALVSACLRGLRAFEREGLTPFIP